MEITLLTFHKGPQFAKNPLKSYMRQREAFRADIFFKFDLENDLFTMTLMYNHFENQFNQLRHLEYPPLTQFGQTNLAKLHLSLY